MEVDELSQREKEYTVQHFGFDPSIIVEELSEDSVEHLSSVLGKMKEQIKKKKAGRFDEEELERCISVLEKKYTEYFTKKFTVLGAYMNKSIFKIPPHTVLKEDAAWDNLKQSDANLRLLSVNAEMEKMRERYKTSLHKRKYLRDYLEKLRQICIRQEETIHKEVALKEKYGLPQSEEILGYIRSKESKMSSRLQGLRYVQGKRRNTEVSLFSREKRAKLESDIKQCVDEVRVKSMQYTM